VLEVVDSAKCYIFSIDLFIFNLFLIFKMFYEYLIWEKNCQFRKHIMPSYV
jgi:hypothetical protein